MRRWLGAGLAYRRQAPGDLGRRMRRAMADAFGAGCRRVVIIGTDCPSLSAEHVGEAFDALREHDLVLGPSSDGGYWLIGLRAPAEVFEGVAWGTPQVLEATLALARREGLSVRLLAELADVDRAEDLQRWRPQWREAGPYVSVIIPALNEAGRVGSAVRSAEGDGVEVLVVDGGSADQTVARARAAGARVLQGRPGRAGQMNLGAAHAAGEVLLFLHADTVLPEGFAGMVFAALADAGAVGGAFEHATDHRGAVMSAVRRLVHLRAKYLHMPYGDQAIFVRRSAFRAVGGFPELAIAEDLHFLRRLRRRGRIAIVPARAITSGRRWRRLGPLRTTVINQLIVAGCVLALPPRWLARLYRRS